MSTQARFEVVQEPAALLQPRARVCNVAIAGFGTVGRSVAEILSYRSLPGLRLTHIFNRRVERKRVSWVPPHVTWTSDIEHLLAADVDVIVEVVGGLDPAEQWVRRALKAGKSVVTANKQLIAHCGPELLQLARRNGATLEFGASVAGGIPVLLGIEQGLSGDQIFKVSGILNGTCNYILTRMEASGASFQQALSEAQQFGFAESDPTDDVEGFDARAKLAILARVALRCKVEPGDITSASIAPIEAVDFVYARELGSTIRQVSRAELDGRHLFASVRPAVVPEHSPLARVNGAQNLVVAGGKYGGEVIFGGNGAGGHPTAVAVVSDLLSIARERCDNAQHPHLLEERVAVTDDFTSPYFVRFVIHDRPGILATIAGVFAKHAINIDSVLQKPGFPKNRLPFVMTLDPCGSSVVQAALGELSQADYLVEPPLALPILK